MRFPLVLGEQAGAGWVAALAGPGGDVGAGDEDAGIARS
jgi:hypothetical protein